MTSEIRELLALADRFVTSTQQGDYIVYSARWSGMSLLIKTREDAPAVVHRQARISVARKLRALATGKERLP